MRDYSSFLNNMAPEQPKPEPHEYPETAELEEVSDIPDSKSDIPMDSISTDNLSANMYSDFGGAGQQTGEQSNIPMESAAPAQTGKRYSAEDYERATSYDYATRNADNYSTIRDRRKTFANNSGENVGFGLVGALLGAALGTGIWYAIGLTGMISSWGALAIVVCCFFGYTLFAKGFGAGGALVVAIAVILSVFCGMRLLYGHFIIENQKQWRDDPKLLEQYDMEPEEVYIPTLFEAAFTDFDAIIDGYEHPEEVRKAYHSDMGTSYLFTGIATIIFFARRMRH